MPPPPSSRERLLGRLGLWQPEVGEPSPVGAPASSSLGLVSHSPCLPFAPRRTQQGMGAALCPRCFPCTVWGASSPWAFLPRRGGGVPPYLSETERHLPSAATGEESHSRGPRCRRGCPWHGVLCGRASADGGRHADGKGAGGKCMGPDSEHFGPAQSGTQQRSSARGPSH